MTDNQNDYPTQYQIGNHLITVTIFPNFAAKVKEVWDMTLPEIGLMIEAENRKRKNLLPWMKLAAFGGTRTPKGSLRHDANVLAISGVEVDHDSGRPIEEAIGLLQAAAYAQFVRQSVVSAFPKAARRERLSSASERIEPAGTRSMVGQ